MAEAPLLSPPVETVLVYWNGLKLTLKAPESKPALEALTLTDKTFIASVPPAEMEDIFNPALSKVQLTDAPMGDPTKREIRVIFEFDDQPFEWGAAASKVEFFFVGGKYVRRVVRRPTGKHSWAEMEKNAGEPETNGSSGGSMPQVAPGE